MRDCMCFFKLSFSLFMVVVCVAAHSESVVVIVNENNRQPVAQGFVKAAYSDTIFEWSDGAKILLYELPVSSSVREVFCQSILNTSAADAEGEWSNRMMSNTIKNAPKVKSEKLVARFVAKNKDAIGYVSESIAKATQGVKIVLTITE